MACLRFAAVVFGPFVLTGVLTLISHALKPEDLVSSPICARNRSRERRLCGSVVLEVWIALEVIQHFYQAVDQASHLPA